MSAFVNFQKIQKLDDVCNQTLNQYNECVDADSAAVIPEINYENIKLYLETQVTLPTTWSFVLINEAAVLLRWEDNFVIKKKIVIHSNLKIQVCLSCIKN